MEALLKTINLTKNFGGLSAVSNVSFSIRKGDLQTIIGPNGAGKSTFFKLITGEIKPSSGQVLFLDQDITSLPQTKVSHLGIAVAYQITNIFPMLTVLENVRVAAQSRKTTFNLWSKALNHKALAEESLAILELIGLADFQGDTAANLSHGDRKRLEIGIALATKPKLLLLDEPTAGLSPHETRQTIELIKKIAEGLTIVLVEHKMKVVMEVSNTITVLHYGKLLAQGTPDDIRNNEEVRRVYLGGVKC
ncbi:MAG: ABC transporter ATP-binding protein [Syntrophus sp. RIFOXYC2_FULL_54_9]|nr:MAG: ABC transporter ATP-binding protein [Syntrophus sp. GWC2_56_31]OHE30890.1 MAG: ABC transporter ATP-binding protein [Syntrophus sp. RIFOXYC2_FULL_54_9]HBB17186.1 ABC transporter ATP-binding protein [Syntrophus sp. (in: bacteria)]